MSIRIVVADQTEVRFYDTERADAPLRLAGQLTDPKARLRDRDLNSDRPGRVFDHAASPNQRRGATGHHSTGDERGAHRHEAELFARQIARELDNGRREHRFDRLVLMAGPPFLGLLRRELPDAVSALVVGEVAKDLLHGPESAVREHLDNLPQPL
jgi:protein required for attachment to host cells